MISRVLMFWKAPYVVVFSAAVTMAIVSLFRRCLAGLRKSAPTILKKLPRSGMIFHLLPASEAPYLIIVAFPGKTLQNAPDRYMFRLVFTAGWKATQKPVLPELHMYSGPITYPPLINAVHFASEPNVPGAPVTKPSASVMFAGDTTCIL